MRKITMTSWMDAAAGGPVSSDARAERVHLRQGELDGACGPYCLYMALIAMGFIDRSNATNLGSLDGRTREGKLRDAIQAFGALSANGTSVLDLEWLSDFFRRKKLKAQTLQQESKKSLVEATISAIDDNALPILGLRWPQVEGGGGHWVLVVGYEWVDIGDEDTEVRQPTRLLCLDPGYEAPTINTWNAVLNIFDAQGRAIHAGKLPLEHWSPSGAVTKCQLDDTVLLSVAG